MVGKDLNPAWLKTIRRSRLGFVRDWVSAGVWDGGAGSASSWGAGEAPRVCVKEVMLRRERERGVWERKSCAWAGRVVCGDADDEFTGTVDDFFPADVRDQLFSEPLLALIIIFVGATGRAATCDIEKNPS